MLHGIVTFFAAWLLSPLLIQRGRESSGANQEWWERFLS